ncbi:MAG: DUF1488 domain-containing protein, partial [Trinickia sp.]
MQISFPNEAPEYSGRELKVAFPALVNGELIWCSVTAEALQDHYGAASSRLEDMVGGGGGGEQAKKKTTHPEHKNKKKEKKTKKNVKQKKK